MFQIEKNIFYVLKKLCFFYKIMIITQTKTNIKPTAIDKNNEKLEKGRINFIKRQQHQKEREILFKKINLFIFTCTLSFILITAYNNPFLTIIYLILPLLI